MPSTHPHPEPGGTAQFAGRTVARVGYGAMQLEHADDEVAVALLRRAVELGGNHIDTAEFYGDSVVNRRIRAALAPYPDHLVVVSKVGATADPGARLALRAAQKPAELRAEVEANLRSLGMERIDAVNLRRMDTQPGMVAEGDQVVDLDDQLAAMVALRQEGKIGAIGLSNVSVDQLRQALPAGIACVQNAYSLTDRSAQQALELCEEHGIAWVPFFPLGGAFPGMAKVVEQDAVRAVAAKLGASPSQVGLAWLLAQGRHVLLIPGTRSEAHLEDNLAAGELTLDQDALAALDASSRVRGNAEEL